MSTRPDPLEVHLNALANTENDSDWAGVRHRARRRTALVLGTAVLVAACLGVGAAFGLYRDVLPWGKQPPAPAPVVKDFDTFFGGKYAPPGMDPHVLAGETRRIATFRNGRHRSVLYVAPTKNGGFCDSFTHLFGGCRQVRKLPPGAPPPKHGEVNPFAIGTYGEMREEGSMLVNTLLAGDLLLPPGTTLSVEFADGASTDIPVIFVSPPIDAGFFFYPVPSEHVRLGYEATFLTARDAGGQIVARTRVEYELPPRRSPGPPRR